jgi:hypothetical protein
VERHRPSFLCLDVSGCRPVFGTGMLALACSSPQSEFRRSPHVNEVPVSTGCARFRASSHKWEIFVSMSCKYVCRRSSEFRPKLMPFCGEAAARADRLNTDNIVLCAMRHGIGNGRVGDGSRVLGFWDWSDIGTPYMSRYYNVHWLEMLVETDHDSNPLSREQCLNHSFSTEDLFCRISVLISSVQSLNCSRGSSALIRSTATPSDKLALRSLRCRPLSVGDPGCADQWGDCPCVPVIRSFCRSA